MQLCTLDGRRCRLRAHLRSREISDMRGRADQCRVTSLTTLLCARAVSATLPHYALIAMLEPWNAGEGPSVLELGQLRAGQSSWAGAGQAARRQA